MSTCRCPDPLREVHPSCPMHGHSPGAYDEHGNEWARWGWPGMADSTCTAGSAPHDLRDHYPRENGWHNPWSERCVKRLPREPYCPNARCPHMTCDAAR